MKVFIKRFSLTNYRSCAKVILSPHPELSVLIGKNGAGKSALLNGILLLKALYSPTPFRNRSKAEGKSRIMVEFAYAEKTIFLKANIFYSLSKSGRDSVIDSEQFWNFREFTGKDIWYQIPLGIVGERSFIHDFRSMRMRTSRFPRNIAGHVNWPYSLDEIPNQIFEKLTQISNFVISASYYSASQFTDPSRCPVSLEVDEEQVVKPEREKSRSGFLKDLYHIKNADNKDEYNEFWSIVGPDGLKLVGNIGFKKLKLPQSKYEVSIGGKVVKKESSRGLIIPSVRIDGNRLSFSQLSEGTFKTLALIFYLITDKGSLLLIEEPEVCVHHGLLKNIIELIKTYAKSKQIIVSTHSDFVLDLMKAENVFLVEKQSKGIGTKVRPISKTLSAKEFEALKIYLGESGNLGEFWRHGGLENER